MESEHTCLCISSCNTTDFASKPCQIKQSFKQNFRDCHTSTCVTRSMAAYMGPVHGSSLKYVACAHFSLLFSTSIVQTLKQHLSNKTIAMPPRLHRGGQCDSYTTTLYRPWSTLWRKWAQIKTVKIYHIFLLKRTVPVNHCRWWVCNPALMNQAAGELLDGWCWQGAEALRPNTATDVATHTNLTRQKFSTTNVNVHAQHFTGQSRPRLCLRPPPRTAVLARLPFLLVAITSTFGTLLVRAR